jgi:hypothetical protein
LKKIKGDKMKKLLFIICCFIICISCNKEKNNPIIAPINNGIVSIHYYVGYGFYGPALEMNFTSDTLSFYGQGIHGGPMLNIVKSMKQDIWDTLINYIIISDYYNLKNYYRGYTNRSDHYFYIFDVCKLDTCKGVDFEDTISIQNLEKLRFIINEIVHKEFSDTLYGGVR